LILVDTSIWIDHLRDAHPTLVHLLGSRQVLCHPWIVGELALGRLSQREEILGLMGRMPQATVATDAEVVALVEVEELQGSGIGYVDAQLLAATRLTSDARLWTSDKRLALVARRLGVGVDP
jgi:predicted nucleic acid-binding protein